MLVSTPLAVPLAAALAWPVAARAAVPGPAWPAEVPATPDAEQARQAAAHELAKEVYQDRPSVWELAWQWLVAHLDPRTVVPGVPSWVSTAIVLLTGLVLLAALILVLRKARPLRRDPARPGPLFEDQRDSRALAAAADAAAQTGHWEAAVLERFRAIIRTLDEYGLLEDYPGLTAHGAGQDAAAALPALAGDLTGAAALFDAVRYGTLTPSASQDQDMRRLAQQVRDAASQAARVASTRVPARQAQA